MAVSLSSQSLSIPRLSAYAGAKPSKTLIFPIQPRFKRQFLSRKIIHLSLPSPILPKINSRRVFKPNFSVENSAHDIEEGMKDNQGHKNLSESGADLKSLPRIESLIKAYKEAILVGDDKVISEIEAVLYSIESKKNELLQNVSNLSAELISGKEKYIRLQADFDNFRKRLEKERLTIRSDAQGEVIESLLSMVDNFERTKQQIRPETEKEEKIDTSYQGIYKQFVEIMRSLHVAAIATVGKPFDPSLHEVIAREESAQFKEGIVIQEVRRGFLLRDRLLRPAMVKVSSGSGKKPTPQSQKSAEQPAAAAVVDEH